VRGLASSLYGGQVVDSETYLVRANPVGRAVEAWSAWRLPFDHLAPAQLVYRAELSSALRALGPGAVLHATYTSPVVTPAVDAENLLFYNVGGAAFQFLGSAALRYERVVAAPPLPPSQVSFTPMHYVHYSITSGDTVWLHTLQGRQMARCDVVDCPRLKNVPSVWRVMKPGMVAHPGAPRAPRDPISVRLGVSAAPSVQLSLPALVKPLIDGFVSALHSYEGEQLDEVAARLGAQLGEPAWIVRALLEQATAAVLGPRAVPHLRGPSLQWSPADDLIIAGEVVREPWQGANGSFTVRGTVFEAFPGKGDAS
jgi:hypothetical protein